MGRMGRAVIAHGQDFEIREYPVPEPEPNTILLRQELSGLCGTDVHNWQNGVEGETLMGHESVGIIDKIGKGVTTDFLGNPIQEGDRVILVPGTSHGAYGFKVDSDEPPYFCGGFADYIYLCYPGTAYIKTDAPPKVAVMIEPFTIGVHALMRSNVQIGDTIVIQGSGAIGLMTLICAKISGAAKLIIVGGPPARLELAKRIGADVIVDIAEVPSEEERTELVRSHTTMAMGADVVFECAGTLSAIPEGLGYAKYGGTFCEIGHFVDVGSFDLNPNRMLMRRNLTVEAIWGSRSEHFVRGLPILEKNEFPFDEMVSHILPLSRVREGFEALNGKYELDDKTVIKIAIGSQE